MTQTNTNPSYFRTGVRSDHNSTTDYEYTKLRDDAPAWVKDAVQEAHDGELPNDWRYATAAQIFDALSDPDPDSFPDEDDPHGILHNLAESLCDIYTADQIRWLADNPNRIQYTDAVLDDTDASSLTTYGLLLDSQFRAISEMCETICEAIRTNSDTSQED